MLQTLFSLAQKHKRSRPDLQQTSGHSSTAAMDVGTVEALIAGMRLWSAMPCRRHTITQWGQGIH